jgi:hypothetical protein
MRRLSLVLVALAAPILAGAHPGGKAKFGPWQPPVMLGPEINSVSTAGPAISRDGLSLYMMRGAGTALSTTDLYVSLRASRKDPWGVPEKLVPAVNAEGYIDQIPGLSRDEHWLYFTSDRPGSAGWDLWACWRRHTHDPFGWEPAINLGPGVNSASLETTGSSFENRRGLAPLLFFASNRLLPGQPPPGPGQLPAGHDIFVSELQADGTWGPAVRDDVLSTSNGGFEDLEGRPMVRFDGLEIIFTSDRPNGVGAVDPWVATRDSIFEPWGTPENLAAVNTSARELHPYLSADGTTLYFARGAAGQASIYMTTRERHDRRKHDRH